MARRSQKEMLEDYKRLKKEHEDFAESLTWQYGVKWVSWRLFWIALFSGLSYFITLIFNF